MTKPHPEPLRLRDDPEIPEDFASALRLEEAVGPSEDEVSSLAQALGIPMLPIALGAAAKGVAAKAAATSVAPAALAPAAVPAAAGLSTWVAGGTAVFLAIAVGGGVWINASRDPAIQPEPTRTSEIETAESTTEPTALDLETEPVLLDDEEAPPVEPTETRAIRARHRAPRRAEPAPPPPPEALPNEGNLIAVEAALIDRAEAALARNPTTALRLANDHRAQFGAGLLAEEREVIAIDALMRLGQREAAAARAEVFERGHRRSVHARRIRQLLESDSR